MDNYVVIKQPNDEIVLGVNDDKETIIEIVETSEDEDEDLEWECITSSENRLVFTLLGVLFISSLFFLQNKT
mgnify:CR=1 FL=1|jgi:hypothetical protein